MNRNLEPTMSHSKSGATLLAASFILGLMAARTGRGADSAAPHPYRLPSVNIKQPVIWGSTCEGPDGMALSFGGEDRDADDGLAHTRLRAAGDWIDLRETLSKDPRQKLRSLILALRDRQKDLLAQARTYYFSGLSKEDIAHSTILSKLVREERLLAREMELRGAKTPANDFTAVWKNSHQLQHADALLKAIGQAIADSGVTPDALAKMRDVQVDLEIVADAVGAEPPPRALSTIVYEPKSKSFVLFGGDHCDYLTCDTWIFDPAARRWGMRHPAAAPPPRANHSWKVVGDGKLVLSGGYTYFSNTDYMGGQYIDTNDGDWTYDVANDRWTGTGKTVAADSRTYRTGPFLPEHFYEAPTPDAAAFQTWLGALPVNVWTKTRPPQLPKVNRDWGSAVLDPDRDLMLRWSGGHCAHGGSDVIQYHLATNRWELCYPVEFPLGQLYDNTEYPGGFNFNRRPWISGHTYQNYGVDPGLKQMIFLGHSPWGYVYDPDRGDWTTRLALPKKMDYYGSMYTLTTTATPQGLICWTEPGEVFRFDAHSEQWKQLKLTGEQLPGAVVDNSTVVYDPRRNRLLFARKPYGDSPKYDGEIYALDTDSLKVSRLSPAGKVAAAAIPYLCQIRYDAGHDLLLVGATLPAGPDGLRRTPAYDCQANKWVSLKITGDDPSGKAGRNVSLGLMYDARRKLFWAVDTNSEVYVLRLEPASAEMHDL
jgi:hypothetical protein